MRENPYDDTPRLIFADYLDDSGDPLGQLIRVQISLAGLQGDDQRRTLLEKQEQSIIAQHGQRWLEPLRQFGVQGISTRCFRRGLIERIRISAENFLLHSDAICLQSPALHTLSLTGLESCFQRFAVAQLPRQIRGLDLTLCRLEHCRSGVMDGANMSWPMMACIEQLTELHLRMTQTTDDAITELCTRDLTNLQVLDLTACGLTAASIFPLAACPTLRNLQKLKLSLNRIGDDGLVAIANSHHLGSLTELEVASNAITNDGANAIARSTTLLALERLNLRANVLSRPQLGERSSYTNLEKLRELDVRNNGPRPPAN